MIARTAFLSAVGIAFAILQSTFFVKVIPMGIAPDLALLVLLAAAWRSGSLTAEISGFVIGLCMDVMSLAPLGFHAFSYTLIGYAFGRLEDKIAPGAIFLPMGAAAVATILKYGFSFLLALVFGLNSGASRYFSLDMLWELLSNAVLSPLVFLIVPILGKLLEGRRGGFR